MNVLQRQMFVLTLRLIALNDQLAASIATSNNDLTNVLYKEIVKVQYDMKICKTRLEFFLSRGY